MTQEQIDNFIAAFNQFDTADCMIFNNLTDANIGEVTSSLTNYPGVSLLCIDFNMLTPEDKDLLCEACLNATINGVLNKKVNTRPCEVR